MKKIIEKLKNISSLGVYVTFSIIVLIIYTVVSQYLAIKYDKILDVLTTCVFGFFGGEVVTCGLIKIFKLKSDKNNFENIIGEG